MKLKPRKNNIGHEVIDCPFCDYWTYVRRGANDPIHGMKRHIVNAAKNEALAHLTDGIEEMPHVEYYKKHTSRKRIVLSESRAFNEDLKLS